MEIGQVKVSRGGFVEVTSNSGLLVLTHDEYHNAMRRGDSVIRNRKLKKADRLATEKEAFRAYPPPK